MNFKFNLSLFLIVVLSCVCYGAENLNSQTQETQLVEDFGKASVERFEQMFKSGEFDFNYHSHKNKCTVIHYAAQMGDLNRVKELVNRGADVNATDILR